MIKYTLPFMAIDGIAWRIDIAKASYSGTALTIRGVGGQTCEHSYDPTTTDDPFSPYIKSTLNISIYNEGAVDVKEFQTAQIKDFTVSLYREGTLKWTGYLNPKGIQNPLKGAPYALSITATCGLELLEKINYVHADLMGRTFETSRCPINYIRQILFVNLGIMLPIRWTNSLACTAFIDEDVLSQSVQWGVDDAAFYSYQAGTDGDLPGPIKTCEYILSGFMAAMECRIMQVGGMWVIRRINELVSGVVPYSQIPGNLDMLVVQSGTENLNQHIGRSGYKFILEDAIMTSVQGVKTCRVTYDANIRENILPNGNQDVLRDPDFDLTPVDWGAYEGSEPTEINSLPGLDGRTGFSTQLQNLTGDNTFFTLVSAGGTLRADGLPIDTKVLIKRISFGFTFSPTNFPFTPVTEVIIWDSRPLEIQVILNLFGVRWFLNEYGFWVLDETYINIVIDGLRLNDIAKIDFDRFQGILMPEPTNRPEAGDVSDLQILFRVKAGITYQVDNIYVKIDNGDDVYESTLDTSGNTDVDERTVDISSSFSGYMLSNFMSDWSSADTECNFRDGLLYEGTLTGLLANSIMRFRYKASQVFNGSIYVANGNWTFDQVYTIDTFGGVKFLPMNAKYNIEKCQVNNLVAMECRNDNLIFTEKYYSSNDKPLSN